MTIRVNVSTFDEVRQALMRIAAQLDELTPSAKKAGRASDAVKNLSKVRNPYEHHITLIAEKQESI